MRCAEAGKLWIEFGDLLPQMWSKDMTLWALCWQIWARDLAKRASRSHRKRLQRVQRANRAAEHPGAMFDVIAKSMVSLRI